MNPNQQFPRETAPEAEDGVARLLRLLPREGDPPPEVSQRALVAATAEWRALVARRHRRRRRFAVAALAAGLLATVGLALRFGPSEPVAVPSPGPVARVEAVFGGHALEPGQALDAGTSLATQADQRLALRLGGDVVLRLDHGTRLELLTRDEMRLLAGAIYVDTGGAEEGRLSIHTPLGTARNLGTQFELRLSGERLRLRVREGRVRLQGPAGVHETNPGQELTVNANGDTERLPVAPYGAAWRWQLDASPAFYLEGRTLAEYLTWLERETGWTLRFAPESLATTVASIRLHGSLEGLTPDRTPEFVLPTCGLAHRLEDGVLTLEDLHLTEDQP